MASSPDGKERKDVLKGLLGIVNSLPTSLAHPTLRAPDFQIDDTTLQLWKHDQLDNADRVLTAAIATSQDPNPYVFASRALVRTRLRLWDAALQDAEEAINLQPSVMGFIAKSLAHVGRGERHKAYRACDIAFEFDRSSHVTFLLLVKAIIVFMAGEHTDAISRLDDLIISVRLNDVFYTVQAYMHLLLGTSKMDECDWEGAIQSFERARAQIRQHARRTPPAISLISGWKFDNLAITIRQRLCNALYAADRIIEAVECFRELKANFSGQGEHLEWALDFANLLCKRLERLGDTAVSSQQHNDAISYYSAALSLINSSPQAILKKRGKALLATGSWKGALDDANQLITLNSSSPWGYELKHAALFRRGDYDNAIDALETMLSKMTQSPDLDIRRKANKYVTPSKMRSTICKIVQKTLHRSPHMLINTTTGQLYNRAEQVSSFESHSTCKMFVASKTTRIDHARIKRKVRHYYRYVVLSHKWEDNEPLFQDMVQVAVYDLERSPAHDKLRMFCKIARDSGFNWAWSDTCCIDKTDHSVLQESLVAMFRWYQNSAMMVVFLRGVHTPSPRGALAASTWNTRAWTLQEYIAAKVVRFYTEDWTLYRNLDVPNHKDSPEIMSEMEEATKIPAQQLVVLRPGLGDIRAKLCLASTRETTRVEDAAYSLLGIFSAIGIPIIYGEGQASLGRLLANIITRSGDAASLAWTGDCSPFNSCLPARITVFNGPATSHLPPPIPDSEQQSVVGGLSAPFFDLDAALQLYDRLNNLPTPRFAESRMTLPCIAFQLPPFSASRARAGGTYRTDTAAFGTVEVRTRYDLSRLRSLYLVHPWLDTLIDHGDVHGGGFVEDDAPRSPETDDEGLDEGLFNEEIEGEEDKDDDAPSLSEGGLPSTLFPRAMTAPVVDRETGARQLVARLGQPFSALLLAAVSTRRRDGAVDYKRVATDTLITARFRENVTLGEIMDNVRVLDVL